MVKIYVQLFRPTTNLNINARMSWVVAYESLKTKKKSSWAIPKVLAVAYESFSSQSLSQILNGVSQSRSYLELFDYESGRNESLDCNLLGRVVQSCVKIAQGYCEICIHIWKLKKHFRFNSFVYMLMIGSSKHNRENYPRKCRWTQKETRVKFNSGLSANRPSNNWALVQNTQNPRGAFIPCLELCIPFNCCCTVI